MHMRSSTATTAHDCLYLIGASRERYGTDYYVASDSWAALHQSTHHLDALRLLSATVHRQGVARWYLQCSSLIVEMRPDAVVEKPDVEMFATHDVAIVREGFHAYSRCDGSSRIQLLEGG